MLRGNTEGHVGRLKKPVRRSNPALGPRPGAEPPAAPEPGPARPDPSPGGDGGAQAGPSPAADPEAPHARPRRRAPLSPVLLALLLFLLPGVPGGSPIGPPPAPSAPATVLAALEIRVQDGRGAPVPGAVLQVRGGPERAMTDARGDARLVLEAPAGHLARFSVERAGFERNDGEVALAAGPNRVTIALREGGRLEGLVVDDEGHPLEGAVVLARPTSDEGREPWRRETDADGRFSFDTLALGEQRVDIDADRMEQTTRRVMASLTAGDPVRFALHRTGLIDGRVVDADDAPVAGARVTLAGSGVWPPRDLETDAEGRFRVEGVPGGVYELRAASPGRVSEPREGILLAAGGHAEVDLVLGPAFALSGRVLEAGTGVAVAGAEVLVAEDALSFSPRAARTAADGTYRVDGLRGVPHRVSVRAEGFVPIIGETRTPAVAAVAVIELVRGAVVAGVVVDDDDRPVAGARIDVVSADGPSPGLTTAAMPATGGFRAALFEAALTGPVPLRGGELGVTLGEVPPIPLVPGTGAAVGGLDPAAGVTDAQGRFSVQGVVPGRVRVLALHPDHAPGSTEPFDVVSGGERTDLRIVMPAGGTVDGRVVDARGFPVERVRIELVSPSEPYPRGAITASDGTFVFEAVAGPVTVTAYPMELAPVAASVEVPTGAVVRVELTLDGDSEVLHGRTVDDRGFAVAQVRLVVRSLRANRPVARIATSGDDGTFDVTGLPPPPYSVEADHPDYAVVRVPRVARVPDELTVTLISGASVRGLCIDSWTRAPVPFARVELMTTAQTVRLERAVSDVRGRFEVVRVPRGAYELRISASGYLPVARPVAMEASARGLEDLDLAELELAPAGTVEGTVVDAYGHPVAGAQVTLADATDRPGGVRTDAEGRFVLPGVPPGDVTLAARHAEQGTGVAGPLRVLPGDTTAGALIHLARDPTR